MPSLPAPSPSVYMDALAQVAGGVAHDLNDLLTVINGHATRLLDAEETASGSVEALNQIHHAGERAARLVRQMLIVSGQLKVRPQALTLNDLVSAAAAGWRRRASTPPALDLELAPALPPVWADADLLEHLLGNLLANAGEATAAGGRVTIRTEARAAGPGAETLLCLQVTDTGQGIAPEILPRIFEPFFSTKGPGRSRGLGLATAQGILRQHGGSLTVDSAVGRGSTFTVLLPTAAPDQVPAAGSPPAGAPAGRRETLLVVEDDPLVRDLTVTLLQDLGYRVLQAESGAEALEVWGRHAPRIALLLTDLLLSDDSNGLDLAHRLRADKPGLRVICISGYGRETSSPALALPPGCKFLRKPCRPRVLADAVRSLLDSDLP